MIFANLINGFAIALMGLPQSSSLNIYFIFFKGLFPHIIIKKMQSIIYECGGTFQKAGLVEGSGHYW